MDGWSRYPLSMLFMYSFGFILIGIFTVFIIGGLSEPEMLVLDIIRLTGAVTLLLSLIGIILNEKIAHYSAILGLVFIGLSGLAINVKIEVFTPSIPAGPGGLIPDILWYLIFPACSIAYLMSEIKKSKVSKDK